MSYLKKETCLLHPLQPEFIYNPDVIEVCLVTGHSSLSQRCSAQRGVGEGQGTHRRLQLCRRVIFSPCIVEEKWAFCKKKKKRCLQSWKGDSEYVFCFSSLKCRSITPRNMRSTWAFYSMLYRRGLFYPFQDNRFEHHLSIKWQTNWLPLRTKPCMFLLIIL